nr:hypothetical protein [uncultured Methanoregula sp.]
MTKSRPYGAIRNVEKVLIVLAIIGALIVLVIYFGMELANQHAALFSP